MFVCIRMVIDLVLFEYLPASYIWGKAPEAGLDDYVCKTYLGRDKVFFFFFFSANFSCNKTIFNSLSREFFFFFFTCVVIPSDSDGK